MKWLNIFPYGFHQICPQGLSEYPSSECSSWWRILIFFLKVVVLTRYCKKSVSLTSVPQFCIASKSWGNVHGWSCELQINNSINIPYLYKFYSGAPQMQISLGSINYPLSSQGVHFTFLVCIRLRNCHVPETFLPCKLRGLKQCPWLFFSPYEHEHRLKT